MISQIKTTHKRILSVFLSILLVQSQLSLVLATEIPTPPPVTDPEVEVPSEPEIPDSPQIPEEPSVPEPDTNVNTPTPLPLPSAPAIPSPSPVPTATPKASPSPKPSSTPKPKTSPTPTSTPASTPAPVSASDSPDNSNPVQGESDTAAVTSGSAQVSSANDPSITTGDANNQATLSNSGNLNASAQANAGAPSVQIANTDNGAGSTNSGSAAVSQDKNTDQSNSADVSNSLKLESDTGDNLAMKNMGETNITTGDANVSGTIINNINTNLIGVMVSEFNIVDNHTGDYVLDFGANCISGCGNVAATDQTNTGNGAFSDNSNVLVYDFNDNTFQSNDANVENQMVLVADSGDNMAFKNTGGDTNITTGDANVSANVVNMVNNNIAGGVYYGVVNIYGDMVGDIVFPEEALAYADQSPGSNTVLSNSGNGAYSDNSTMLTNNQSKTTEQINNAAIGNSLTMDAQTGDNSADMNTAGGVDIKTGNSNTQAQVVNVANTNLEGGNMWLVIINQAGQWIGQIVGAPLGALMAASEGSDVSVDGNGTITLSNQGNGTGSTNTTEVQANQSETVTQINNANVQNNIKLAANTGGNTATMNTGGDNSITTGDANIIASIVNFVNNNISGGGKLFVTTVNVFGTWVGNFITPGQSTASAVGNPAGQSEIGDEMTNAGIGGYINPEQSSNQPANQTAPDSQSVNEASANTALEEILPQSPVLAPSNSHGNLRAQVLGQSQPVGTDEGGSDLSPVNNLVGLQSESEPAKSKLEINLAWLLGLLPASVAWLIARKFWFVA